MSPFDRKDNFVMVTFRPISVVVVLNDSSRPGRLEVRWGQTPRSRQTGVSPHFPRLRISDGFTSRVKWRYFWSECADTGVDVGREVS